MPLGTMTSNEKCFKLLGRTHLIVKKLITLFYQRKNFKIKSIPVMRRKSRLSEHNKANVLKWGNDR